MDECSESVVEGSEIKQDITCSPNASDASEQVEMTVSITFDSIPAEETTEETIAIPTATTISPVNGSDCEPSGSNEADEPTTSSPKSKRRSYDPEYKLYVAELAEKFSNRSVARVFNIDDKRVREWRKQKDKWAKIVQNEAASQVSADASKKKRSYSAEFKLRAVEMAEKSSNRAAARAVNVHEKRIREWRKQKDQLQQASTSRKRLDGGGRKPVYMEFEGQLLEWIKEARSKEIHVTRTMVQQKALDLSQETLSGFPGFSASRGWMNNFFRRNGLVAVGKNQLIEFSDNKSIIEDDAVKCGDVPRSDIEVKSEIIGNTNLSELVIKLGESLQGRGSMEDDSEHLRLAEPPPSMAISSHLLYAGKDGKTVAPAMVIQTVPKEEVSTITAPADSTQETTPVETTALMDSKPAVTPRLPEEAAREAAPADDTNRISSEVSTKSENSDIN